MFKKILLALLMLTMFLIGANGEWSKFPVCDSQHDKDRVACNSMPKPTTQIAKSNRESCWSSANERLAICSKSGGKTVNSPKLFTAK